jgi:hypothetical protein
MVYWEGGAFYGFGLGSASYLQVKGRPPAGRLAGRVGLGCGCGAQKGGRCLLHPKPVLAARL